MRRHCGADAAASAWGARGFAWRTPRHAMPSIAAPTAADRRFRRRASRCPLRASRYPHRASPCPLPIIALFPTGCRDIPYRAPQYQAPSIAVSGTEHRGIRHRASRYRAPSIAVSGTEYRGTGHRASRYRAPSIAVSGTEHRGIGHRASRYQAPSIAVSGAEHRGILQRASRYPAASIAVSHTEHRHARCRTPGTREGATRVRSGRQGTRGPDRRVRERIPRQPGARPPGTRANTGGDTTRPAGYAGGHHGDTREARGHATGYEGGSDGERRGPLADTTGTAAHPRPSPRDACPTAWARTRCRRAYRSALPRKEIPPVSSDPCVHPPRTARQPPGTDPGSPPRRGGERAWQTRERTALRTVRRR
jgi:hypothetical protein